MVGAPAGAQSAGDNGAAGTVQPAAQPVPSQFIVTLRTPGAGSPQVAAALTATNGGHVIRTYSHALSGYAARMSDA
jgi:hypothetical protein